jgi:isoquinoline 1-oxidoreductase beta subunit
MDATARQEIRTLSRRDFVRTVAAIGGGLALAMELRAQEAGGVPPARSPGPPKPLAAFVRIGPDDSITIVTPAVEMGQGGHTSLPMIILEELDGDWNRVRVEDAPADAIYNNPLFGQQATVGSFAVRGWYAELRRIGATARTMLIQAAAEQWNVPPSSCSAAASRITHQSSGRSCSFGSVAAHAATLPVPQQVTLKSTTEFTLIGTSPRRVDVADKVDGSARYGIDVHVPGMLYAAIKASPSLSGQLRSLDDSAARRLPGYRATVRLPDAVIVVADRYWQARQALEAIKVEFDPGKLGDVDSAEVSRRLQAGVLEAGAVVRHDGDAPGALAKAESVIEAVYEVPYLAHACMEPMNCTARVDAQGCEIWCGTQMPQAAQGAAAKVLGIAPSAVKVNSMYLGGGFGRRGEVDYVTQTVAAAKAIGRPVKLIWSREEDIQHDFYRPAAAIRFRGAVDSGQLLALDCNVATASAPSFGGRASPGFYTGGVADASYAIPNFRVTGVNQDIGVRFGFWRSVNDSHNPFMLESFIDELAHRAKQDPYRFRRAMLQHPAARRQLKLLDLIAEKADWDHPPSGHFLGIAAFLAYGSYIGTVAEVSVSGKTVTLHRVVAAIDCGTAIHPDNIRAQLEGGMVYGLTAAVHGEITLAHGAVQQTNFADYPVLTMAQIPRVDCFIAPSGDSPGGVGEPGTAPIAPALANAIFAATGTRVRSLPLSRHGLELAVARA